MRLPPTKFINYSYSFNSIDVDGQTYKILHSEFKFLSPSVCGGNWVSTEWTIFIFIFSHYKEFCYDHLDHSLSLAFLVVLWCWKEQIMATHPHKNKSFHGKPKPPKQSLLIYIYIYIYFEKFCFFETNPLFVFYLIIRQLVIWIYHFFSAPHS